MRVLLLCLITAALVGCAAESRPANSDAPVAANPQTGDAVETTSSPSVASAAANEYVIDVRSPEEWETGHVSQAVNIPHTEIAERISEVTDDKQAKIVLYCAVGGRAGKAKDKLEELGFTNVENAGGYDDVKDRYK